MLRFIAVIGLLLGIVAGVSVSASVVLLLLAACVAVIVTLACIRGGGDTVFAAFLIAIFFAAPFTVALVITNLVAGAL